MSTSARALPPLTKRPRHPLFVHPLIPRSFTEKTPTPRKPEPFSTNPWSVPADREPEVSRCKQSSGGLPGEQGGRVLCPLMKWPKVSVVCASSYPPVVYRENTNTAQTRTLFLRTPGQLLRIGSRRCPGVSNRRVVCPVSRAAGSCARRRNAARTNAAPGRQLGGRGRQGAVPVDEMGQGIRCLCILLSPGRLQRKHRHRANPNPFLADLWSAPADREPEVSRC